MSENADLHAGGVRFKHFLLVRPKRALDESDVGYHARLAAANGLLPAHIQMANQVNAGSSRLMGHSLPQWAMRSEWKKTSHMCVSCMRESRVIKQSWRVRYVLCCAHHDERLVMLRTALGQAQSHADTMNLDPEELPDSPEVLDGEEAEAHALFKSLWPDLASDENVSATNLAISAFLSSILHRLTFARRGRDIQDKDSSLWVHIKRWLETSHIHVSPTEEACEKLLCELPTQLHQAVAIRWIESILKAEAEEETVLSTLPLSVWLQQLRALAGPIRTTGRGALGGVVIEAMTTEGLPVKTAARRAGVSKKRLISLLKIAEVEPLRRFERARKFLVIDVRDVQMLAQLAPEYLTAAAAMSELEVTGQRFIMRILRLTGLVERFRREGHDFYKLSEIREALLALSQWAEPYQGQPSVSLADPAFYRHVDLRVVKQTMDAIRSGQSLAWHDPSARGLRSIRVPLVALTLAHRLSWCYRYGRRVQVTQLELPYAG
jgi:hypothetical protein